MDVDVVEGDEEEAEVSAFACFARARQAAAEVQVRHLDDCVSCDVILVLRLLTVSHPCPGQRPWAVVLKWYLAMTLWRSPRGRG